MKLINAKLHGIIDYLVVAFLWLSPSLFGLSDLTGNLTYALGAVHLPLTVLTDFPSGVIKLIPLKFHGIVELLVSVVLVVLAFVFLNGIDFYFYIAFGIAVFVTWLLTDYR